MGKADTIKSDILTKAKMTYEEKSMGWVSTDLEGKEFKSTRVLVLTGTAETLLAREEAETLAKQIEGVTAVTNNIVVQTAEEPTPPAEIVKEELSEEKDYLVSVTKEENGKVLLEGFVSSNESHLKIVAKAKNIFGDLNVTDKLQELENAPVSWEESIELGLTQLAEVEFGYFKMENNNFTFEGEVNSAEKEKQLLSQLEKTLAKEYASEYSINVKPTDKKVVVIKTPEPKKVASSTIASQAKSCQKNFRNYLSKEKINFSTNKAHIKKSSHHLLNELIKIAKSCPKNKIIIEGHTDSDGLRKYNKKLSERRASAVKSYLVKHGIKANRLKSVGYGEMKPIAKNSTKAGKKQNRRIEFNVKGVK
jgi:outer membrane protein OmpA-like peptidoglycan-associated protein